MELCKEFLLKITIILIESQEKKFSEKHPCFRDLLLAKLQTNCPGNLA